jgi:alpha-beta hydrolase superfamily lysophospholipase
VIDRFAQFPADLARRVRRVSLAGVPALIAHPDWQRPTPAMIWMHGRTVSKELDPGRYLRWVRAGIAAVALDLPGHGERSDAALQHPRATLDVLERMTREIDGVTDALADRAYEGLIDLARLGLGGMSAGGMATLSRLCDGHDFVCAAVEGTTGSLEGLYFPSDGRSPPWGQEHDRARVRGLDPMRRLAGWRPLPLLALHSERDEVVPVGTLREFLAALRARYAAAGASPELIELRTWEETGAPREHAGFGRFGNEAKNAQLEFLVRHLRPEGGSVEVGG